MTTLSLEQQEHLASLVEKYINKMTAQNIDFGKFEAAVGRLYNLVGYNSPTIVYCQSPQELTRRVVHIQAINYLEEEELEAVVVKVSEKTGLDLEAAEVLCQAYLDDLMTSNPPVRPEVAEEFEKAIDVHDSLRTKCNADLSSCYFYTYWLQGTLAYAEAAEYLGVEVDKEAVNTLRDFGQIVGYMLVFTNACFVSLNPLEVKIQDGELHCDDGPAITYKDGYKVWALEGMLMDEQVIMYPQEQPLDVINKENNAEKKRIRISRYGWIEYLEKNNAEVVESRIIKLPAGSTWMESLMHLDDMTVLCTYDPSTGRPYALEVRPQCKNCEEAQAYLLSVDEALRGCSFRPSSVLPVLRT